MKLKQMNLKKMLLSLSASFFSNTSIAQYVTTPAFEKKINSLVSDFKSDVKTVENLRAELGKNKNILLLDAREVEEYSVSHIAGAVHVGYKNFNVEKVESKLRALKLSKSDVQVVVYCSVGYRSGVIADKLIEIGFKNTTNLFGGIFEWSNHEYELVDSQLSSTKKVHTYNKSWSKWLVNGEKVN